MNLLNDYTKSYPLDIRLLNQDHESVLYISNDPQNVSITITNVSDESIQFNVPFSDESSDKSYHILITFKPDIIDPTNDIIISSDHSWAMGKAEVADNGSIMVAFQLTEVLTLKPSEQTIIALANLKANASSGARVTQVQANIDEISFTSDTSKLIHYAITTQLSIINQRGKKNIPLHFGFAGSNTVLNDGVSPSNLTLQITNTATINSLNPDLSEITFNCDSESNAQSYFIISFLADDKNQENALGKTTEISSIKIVDGTQNWEVVPKDEGDKSEWVLTPKKAIPAMQSGETFDIQINQIISSAPTGLTYMKVSYFNIPGYWDGDVMVAIMKQPLITETFTPEVFDSTERMGSVVGIGTIPEKAPITVDGNSENTGNLIVDGNLKVNGRIADSIGMTVPPGGIIMWYGDEGEIPDGWALCNGEQGTPDLRGRFVLGAGSPYPSKDTGGHDLIRLSEDQLPKHDHNVRLGDGEEKDPEPKDGTHKHRLKVDTGDGGDYGGGYNMIKVIGYDTYTANHKALVDTDESAHTHKVYQDKVGKNKAIDIRPKFYSLCYIMKLHLETTEE